MDATVYIDTDGTVEPPEFSYERATRRELLLLALGGDAEAFARLGLPARSGQRHMKGKHDQLTHGHGGKGKFAKAGSLPGGGPLPQGWTESNPDALEASFMAAVAARKARGTYTATGQITPKDEELLAAATHVAATSPGREYRVYKGKGDTFLYVSGHAEVSDADLSATMEQVSDLQARFPAQDGARIFVDRADVMPEGVGGMTFRGTGEMRLNAEVVAGTMTHHPYLDREIGDQRRYVLAHEWGHTQDQLTRQQRDTVAIKILAAPSADSRPRTTTYGMDEPQEMLAESFADFATTEPGQPYRLQATDGWAEALHWEVSQAARSAARHLPGKHDQKTHGHGGNVQLGLPGTTEEDEATDAAMAGLGWRREKVEDFAGEWAFKAKQSGLIDPSTPIGQEPQPPPGLRIWRKGRNRIYADPTCEVTEGDMVNLARNVNDYSTRFPVKGGLYLSVDPQMYFPDGCGGMTVQGTGMMRLSDRTVAGGAEIPPHARGDITPSRYVLGHEWGHTQDHMSPSVRDRVWLETMDGTTAYGRGGGPDEAYAESFVDFAEHPDGNYQLAATPAWVEAAKWRGED